MKSTEGLIDKWHRLACGDTAWRDEQEYDEIYEEFEQLVADELEGGHFHPNECRRGG